MFGVSFFCVCVEFLFFAPNDLKVHDASLALHAGGGEHLAVVAQVVNLKGTRLKPISIHRFNYLKPLRLSSAHGSNELRLAQTPPR